MPDSESAEPAKPIPSSPLHANCGPRDGLIMLGGAPVMGVLDGTGPHAKVIGIAWRPALSCRDISLPRQRKEGATSGLPCPHPGSEGAPRTIRQKPFLPTTSIGSPISRNPNSAVAP